jgi:hypothetical protein
VRNVTHYITITLAQKTEPPPHKRGNRLARLFLNLMYIIISVFQKFSSFQPIDPRLGVNHTPQNTQTFYLTTRLAHMLKLFNRLTNHLWVKFYSFTKCHNAIHSVTIQFLACSIYTDRCSIHNIIGRSIHASNDTVGYSFNHR